MTWQNFLQLECRRKEYALTMYEIEVIMCLDENRYLTKSELLEIYIKLYSHIEEEAFTQRLKNIYRKFDINVSGHKLPSLHKYLKEKFIEYKNKDIFFSEIGLNYIHSYFPREKFGQEIDNVINLNNQENKKVDILQTFAPNLHYYTNHLIRCLQNDVYVSILLAWPYSEAAKLREDVLRKYANIPAEEINIRDYVIANLETLEKVIKVVGNTKLLSIKLYDTLPSLAMYRAGNYVLTGFFLHGSLAIDTFQIELNLNASERRIADPLQQEFDLMSQVSRSFHPDPKRNWRNDLKILFTR